jgi:hypothetical protein
MGALEAEAKRLALTVSPDVLGAVGLPEVISLVGEVWSLVVRACPDRPASELRSSAEQADRHPRLHRLTVMAVRNRANEVVEAAYGRRREIGKQTFNRLADELTRKTIEEAARADETRIEAVRLAVLKSPGEKSHGR